MKKSSMKKSIALGLALAMGTSLLAACGGSATTSSSEQTSSANASSEIASTETSGDTIRIGGHHGSHRRQGRDG